MPSLNALPSLEDHRSRKIRRKEGRRRASLRDPAAVTVEGSFQHLSNRLFVIRESGEYELELLAKMQQQTLDPFADEPSIAEVLDMGIDPILPGVRGLTTRSRLRAREILSSDTRRRRIGVLFRVGDDWFLYLLASAGKRSSNGDNDATTAIIDAIDELRPRMLVTGPISRIVRTGPNGALVAEHLKRSRTLVMAQSFAIPLDLTEPTGMGMWDMLVRQAEADYHATLRRLLTGVVFELKNGRYPQGKVPYGYRKRIVNGKRTHEVEPDPEQQPIVHSIIELAAGDKPLADIADELVRRHQLVSRGPKHSDSPVPANEVKHPDTLVRHLFQALPLYADGIHRMSYEVTIPHLDDLYGIPVSRVSPDDNGHIVVDLPFGLPPGGWADPALIEAAIIRRLTDEDPTPRRDRTEVRPMASLVHWFDGGFEYRLSTEDDHYSLRRRPEADAEHPNGQRAGFDSYDGDILGSFPDREFHDTIADALLQIGDDVSSDIRCERSTSDEDVAAIENERRAAADAAAAARREATIASSPEACSHYRELAAEHQAIADQLASQLDQRRRAIAVDDLLVDGEQLADVINGLRSADPFGPVGLNRSLSRLLRNVRIEATARDPLASISFEVELLTNQGTVMLGPIRATLPNHALGVGPTDPEWSASFVERRKNLMRYVVLEEADRDQQIVLMRSFPTKQRKWREAATKILVEQLANRDAVSALIDCPVLGVRRTVLGPILGSTADHGLDPRLAAEVRAVYLDPNFEWSKSWCPGGMDRRRSVLRFVDRYDRGDGVSFEVLRDHLAINEPDVYRLIGAEADGTKYAVSTVGTHPCLEDVDDWYRDGRRRRGAERRVRVRPCPHCGERKLLQPLKVPEVVGQLLCTACRRDPVSGMAFPDDYFVPWDGPQSAAWRDGRLPSFDRFEGLFLDDKRQGTHPVEPVVPSLHSPRRRR